MDPDEWPAYCAMCDRGYEPKDASHFCDACIKAMDEDEDEEHVTSPADPQPPTRKTS